MHQLSQTEGSYCGDIIAKARAYLLAEDLGDASFDISDT